VGGGWGGRGAGSHDGGLAAHQHALQLVHCYGNNCPHPRPAHWSSTHCCCWQGGVPALSTPERTLTVTQVCADANAAATRSRTNWAFIVRSLMPVSPGGVASLGSAEKLDWHWKAASPDRSTGLHILARPAMVN